MSITHRFVETNGIRMHLAEAGSGAPVTLCHGFPESWYSWRHQLEALAKEGFRAIAPDMRGYGQTQKPEAIDQYTLFHLTGDMIDALNIEKAAVIGHDWGAPVASRLVSARPFCRSCHAKRAAVPPQIACPSNVSHAQAWSISFRGWTRSFRTSRTCPINLKKRFCLRVAVIGRSRNEPHRLAARSFDFSNHSIWRPSSPRTSAADISLLRRARAWRYAGGGACTLVLTHAAGRWRWHQL
jgi:pimeloyl-ACP methyl ester carboxylesterase